MNENKKSIKWRPASTVILIREREEVFQIYLLKRSEKSRFFPGYYVFPGGAVEEEDHIGLPSAEFADMSQEIFIERLGGGKPLKKRGSYWQTEKKAPGKNDRTFVNVVWTRGFPKAGFWSVFCLMDGF